MNSNLKMTVERSKRCSHFLLLVFIIKCFSKNLLSEFVLSQKEGMGHVFFYLPNTFWPVFNGYSLNVMFELCDHEFMSVSSQ